MADQDAPVIIRRRGKGARPGAALSSRSSAADLTGNGDEDAGSPVVVRPKTVASKLGAQARKPARLSFGVDEVRSTTAILPLTLHSPERLLTMHRSAR